VGRAYSSPDLSRVGYAPAPPRAADTRISMPLIQLSSSDICSTYRPATADLACRRSRIPLLRSRALVMTRSNSKEVRHVEKAIA
jgi:hypothetical protein